MVLLHYDSLCAVVQYVLLGGEEGLFTLQVTSDPDPVMEQVSLYPALLHAYCYMYASKKKGTLRTGLLYM